MKIFRYTVEPDQRSAMAYIRAVLESGIASSGTIKKNDLCKLMVTDAHAVHYTKQCTGEGRSWRGAFGPDIRADVFIHADKPKLYVKLEKDSEFLGAIEFSNEQQMRSMTLKNVREMAQRQLFKLPEDFAFMCQGRVVQRVWEADKAAWDVLPFALRGSPGLSVHALVKNRRLDGPRRPNPFEFRYMGSLLARYKKKIQDVKPVCRRRAFRLGADGGKPLQSDVGWRVAENWSGEWIYDQRRVRARTWRSLQKRLRTAVRANTERIVVKDDRGQLISPWAVEKDGEPSRAETESRPTTSVGKDTATRQSIRPSQVIPMEVSAWRAERLARAKKIKWKARVIAMKALQCLEEPTASFDPLDDDKENDVRQANRTPQRRLRDYHDARKPSVTVLVHVADDVAFPSRLLRAGPSSRRQRKCHEHTPTRRDKTRQTETTATKKPFGVHVLHQELTLQTPSTMSTGDVELGPFQAVSNITLEEDEVEVFPVLVIRPLGDLVDVQQCDDDDDDDAMDLRRETLGDVPPRARCLAHRAYLSEYEFAVGRGESHFEHIYHHVHGRTSDLIHLNRRDVLGRTLLHDAAEFAHHNLLELLLGVRVLRDVTDQRGETPLHHAARRGHLREVSALLREGAAPWKLNSEGKSPLYVALEAAAYRLGRTRPSHLRPPTIESLSLTAVTATSRRGGGGSMAGADRPTRRNFLADNQTYTKLRQVIDLLWDRYPPKALVTPDHCGYADCLGLEQQVFGDLLEASRDGNVGRVQRLVDLEKRAVPQYLNEQLSELGRTALHEATEQGHSAVVDLLLKLGADGYLRDQQDQVPLHAAARRGHERIAACLQFKFPGTLGMQDRMGKTPLHHAVERRHTTLALALIAAIAEVHDPVVILDLQDVMGYTALHYASANGLVAVCEALVRLGAATNISRCAHEMSPPGADTGPSLGHLLGVYWKRPLPPRGVRPRAHRAAVVAATTPATMGVVYDLEAPAELLLVGCRLAPGSVTERLRILRLLLQQHPPHGNDARAMLVQGRVKRTPLPLYHLASAIAAVNPGVAVDVAKALHELKVEINTIDETTGESAILRECKRIGDGALARRQQRQQGTEDLEDDGPLELAFVRVLLQLGANVDLPNTRNGETPLGAAAITGHLPLLSLLLECGAGVNLYPPKTSFSALHFAALGGHVPCARALLGHRANVNALVPPTNDEAPLFFAIRSGSEAMVELLLHQGADPCALCTLQRAVRTSFDVVLDLDAPGHRRRRSHRQSESASTSSLRVATPLTFALLLTQALMGFGSQVEDVTIQRATQRRRWEALERIATLVARRAIATMTPGGSAGSGLVTPVDVQLACEAGYWDLARLLLTQQVRMAPVPTTPVPNALHLAAAAGQTEVVTALVAAGATVNCRWEAPVDSAKRRRGAADDALVMHRGALFFALSRGRIETAARLLVLGADVLESVPHRRLVVRSESPSSAQEEPIQQQRVAFQLVVHEVLPKPLRDRFFAGLTAGDCRRHRPTETLGSDAPSSFHPHRVAINFVHHLAAALNHQESPLYYAARMGYTSNVELLLEAGVHVLQAPGAKTQADTAIHAAVLGGHLGVVRVFAARVAQHNFPRFFARENHRVESLVVTACRARELGILRFLLSDGHAEVPGGGFNSRDTPEDLDRGLNACAAVHFEEGFATLLRERARPDLMTLVQVLENVNWVQKERAVLPTVGDEVPGADAPTQLGSFAPPRRRPRLRLGATTLALLQGILPFAKHFDQFFAARHFDHVLKILIICSQYELWFVLHEVFVANARHFQQPLSPWTPLVVRGASCCLVLHRAAIANQVSILRFFLRLGAPANLRLVELPRVRCPIWYAASRGAVDAFLLLALASKDLIADLDGARHAPLCRAVFRGITHSRSWLAPSSSRCRWQNLSVMSCYDVPRAQTHAYVIQKLIRMALDEHRQQVARGNTLLHLAAAQGDLQVVRLLVEAGADPLARNAGHETPLALAAARKDSFGTPIVRCLVAALATGEPDDVSLVLGQALVRCYAQPAPCNLKTAKALLAAGADANFHDDLMGNLSAMECALRSAQFAATKILLDNGAQMTIPLVEAFLRPLLVPADNVVTHWRRFSSFLRDHGQRIVDVEGIILLLLERKNIQQAALNEDLLHQLLLATSAIAATTATVAGMAPRFWDLVRRLLGQFPREIASRKSEWQRKSALHYAVLGLDVEVVRMLVETGGFEPDAEDERQTTPLHVIARLGDVSICRILLAGLKDPARIDARDCQGRTPLHLAAMFGHEVLVRLFLAANASVQARCARGLNAPLYAIKVDQVAVLMALYEHDSTRELVYTVEGEFGIFVAARYGAFGVVRWFMGVFDPTAMGQQTLGTIACKHGRTLLHYAAAHGDVELAKVLIHQHHAPVDVRDASGYSPLLYAFGFGRIAVLKVLLDAGADVTTSIDHSGEAGSHPYACSFGITSLGRWFALPGWLSHAMMTFPAATKALVTAQFTSEEHYLLTSGYRVRRVRVPIRVDTFRRPSDRAHERIKVRTTMRTWRFPRVSLAEFACDVGDDRIIELLAGGLGRLGLTRSPSFAVQRRMFLQAVRWNKLAVVRGLLEGVTDSGSSSNEAAAPSPFDEFLEAGVDCAASRGLEDMAILLLTRWQATRERAPAGADASAFAFQFAQTFQVACIRGMATLVRWMIERGGEALVAFHWNEGPSLVYAFAFGHGDIAELLLRSGGTLSSMDTFVAPSIKKWVEYGGPPEVHVHLPSPPGGPPRSSTRAFVGPLGGYDDDGMADEAERLPVSLIAMRFSQTAAAATSEARVDDVELKLLVS